MPLWSQILFAFAVAWGVFWAYMATRSKGFLLLLAGLAVLHWFLADHGVYLEATAIPPPQALLLGPVVLGLVITLLLPAGRRWLRGLDPVALVMLSVLRVPVELVLHEGWANGLVPQGMTYSGHNFDIFSGLSAAIMAAWLVSKRPPGRGMLLTWNVVCLVLLAIVVGTGVLSIPSVVQRMNFDQPLVLVRATPYVLLPALLVPLVLWSHVALLMELSGGRRERP